MINWSVITTPNKTMSLLNAKLICNKLEMTLDNLGVSNLKDNIFIEKSLENFFYIELILKIFPKAKFIKHIEMYQIMFLLFFSSFYQKYLGLIL